MKYKRIDEIAFINNSSITSKTKFEFINYLDTGNITCGKIDKIQYLENTKYPSRAKRLVKYNDIIFSTVRPNQCHYGILKYILPNMVVSTGFTVLSAKEGVDKDYLYYYLTLPEIVQKLQNIAETSTSAYPSIKPDDIGSLQIPLPDIEIQEKIGYILSNISAKIEINNKINENLQSISKLLFKHWFIDFEFPSEEGLPYKSTGGEMVDSELGLIPKGWEVRKIQEVIDVRDGTHESPKPKEIGYPLITSKHLLCSGIDFSSANFISQEDYDEINKRSKVDTDDILITMIGTVGNIYRVDEKNINFAIKNVGLFKTSNNKIYANYIYMYLKSDDMKQYVKERLAGSTQQYISLGELRKMPVIIPDMILDKFNKLIEPIFEKLTEIKEENKSIINLRYILLPKLMNGEIDLSNIELNQ